MGGKASQPERPGSGDTGGEPCGLIRAAPGPAHARIDLQVNRQVLPRPLCRPGKPFNKTRFRNKGNQIQAGKLGKFFFQGLGQEQDRRFYPGGPQFRPFLYIGHREVFRPGFQSGPGNGNGPVTVSIGLDRDADLRPAPRPSFYSPDILTEQIKIYNSPARPHKPIICRYPVIRKPDVFI
jgi:hypothetical protein